MESSASRTEIKAGTFGSGKITKSIMCKQVGVDSVTANRSPLSSVYIVLFAVLVAQMYIASELATCA